MKMTDYSVCLSGSCEWLQALNDKVRLVFGRLDRSLSPGPHRLGRFLDVIFHTAEDISRRRDVRSPAPKNTRLLVARNSS